MNKDLRNRHFDCESDEDKDLDDFIFPHLQEDELDDDVLDDDESSNELDEIGQNVSSPLISLNEIDVLVKCEIGTARISLSNLANLTIGDSIEFDKWPNFVKLSANGINFAEGVLVEIAGQLGVKITHRYNRS